MNVICITGNLGGDVELRTTNSGKEVASFSVGVRKQFKSDETDWFRVSAWGQQAKYASDYGSKGRKVAVTGRMESRKYSKDGVTREVWELTADNIEFLDRPKDGAQGQGESAATSTQAPDTYDPFEGE